MKKKKINRDLISLAVSTLLTVAVWIGFDVYRALTRYTLPEILDQQMQPLDPKLNQEIINQLKERFRISEEELGQLEELEPVAEANETTPSANPSGQPGEE